MESNLVIITSLIFSQHLQLSKSLPKNVGTVIVKHGNPCGVSLHKNNTQSFMLAHKCDPISAFGGIVSCNFKINKKLAIKINKLFFEVIIGNGFDKECISYFKRKKNIRVINAKNYKISDTNNFISNNNFTLLKVQILKV